MANILFLDNFDSFSYNIVDDLRSMGHNVEIYRNDASKDFVLKLLEQMENPILFLSPGPGYPENAGCMMSVLKVIRGKYPVIGICLGHQAIIESYGGTVIPAPDYVHGECSKLIHDNLAMFENMPNPMVVARYHSLVGTEIPEELTINAKIDNLPMSVRDNTNRVVGFQFHPESILTTNGYSLLRKTIEWVIR